MERNPFRFPLQILTFLTLLHFCFSHPDLRPLMAFKSASDAANKLTNWNLSAGDPCSFYGVSCLQNRVSHLVLEDLGLQGGFEPLTSLDQLHVLSLKHNRLSGHIPDLSNLTSLKLLFLSHNGFSGKFPAFPFRLYRLDLSYNNFSGEIPDGSVNRLTHLLTLRLEENQFSGAISSLDLPNLQDFNVSGNRLTGEVPKSLSGFPNTSFVRNPVLCGSPLPSCKSIVRDPSKPGSKGATASPLTPAVVPSSPTAIPDSSPATTSPASTHRTGEKLSAIAIVGIILGDVLVLALISGLLFCYFWRHLAGKARDRETTSSSQLIESEKIVYSARSPYASQNGGFERGKMVFFEGGERFELEDLLRASAEMLGKGGFGTAYKAMLDHGNVVAVKRLKEAQLGGKREFELQMDVLGRLRHPNVVSLVAYYFARDEKLLVYDYMPNGSLFWLLHGNRGPGRTPLDWTTRMKVASGVAHGLAFIHHCNHSPKLSHGNLKSTNVLLDKSWNPRLSDFGLNHFASPTSTTKPNGYRAPEALTDGRKFSHQKADVYAFGVLLLEILTGKCPSTVDNCGGDGGVVIDLPKWVQSVVREEWTAEVFDLELMRYKDIEEEMVGLLQIAMACTCVAPDQRPRIGSVVRMIEEIRGVEVSPSYESFESDSPSVSELTDG